MVKNLKLKRPIVFLDLETTGTDVVNDRIIEIGLVKLHADGRRETVENRFNPGIPIEEGATEKHSITDDDVKGCPKFGDKAKEILDFLIGCDIGGFNIIRFDLKMLGVEVERCGLKLDLEDVKVVDSMVIYHEREKRDLDAAYRFYCGRTRDDFHNAIVDVEATIEILIGQMNRYDDIPEDVDSLHELCVKQKGSNAIDQEGKFIWKNGVVVMSFGKYKGKTLEEMAKKEKGFLNWIISKDFAKDTKRIARRALLGYIPVMEMAKKTGEEFSPVISERKISTIEGAIYNS